MSQRRTTASAPTALAPATAGRVAVSTGLAVVVAALPLVAGIGAGFLADAATLKGAVALAFAAMDVPLGSFGGTWVLGAGLFD